MSVYVIKNEKGEYLDLSTVDYHASWNAKSGVLWADREIAESNCSNLSTSAHVVELIKKPVPVELNEEEAAKVIEMRRSGNPGQVLADWTGNTVQKFHLMDAYVNDWVVKKRTIYNVKVPHLSKIYVKEGPADLGAVSVAAYNRYSKCAQFTYAEIRQYGLEDCERKEVTWVCV